MPSKVERKLADLGFPRLVRDCRRIFDAVQKRQQAPLELAQGLLLEVADLELKHAVQILADRCLELLAPLLAAGANAAGLCCTVEACEGGLEECACCVAKVTDTVALLHRSAPAIQCPLGLGMSVGVGPVNGIPPHQLVPGGQSRCALARGLPDLIRHLRCRRRLDTLGKGALERWSGDELLTEQVHGGGVSRSIPLGGQGEALDLQHVLQRWRLLFTPKGSLGSKVAPEQGQILE
mmetsp:Transcript_26874/g.78244  ORF Transcript_26874/g.78244 Transcript_26874/m.78244 type:complete len:236 (-) Transcript_26874:601-1308(-)